MNTDRDDTLLDACLDEVLAGRSPPDLTARIVQAHAARRVVDPSVLPAELPGPAVTRFESEVVPPPIVAAANGRPVVELAPARPVAGRKKSASEWQSVLVAASVIGICLVVGLA